MVTEKEERTSDRSASVPFPQWKGIGQCREWLKEGKDGGGTVDITPRGS
jgi:hypothetical protein